MTTLQGRSWGLSWLLARLAQSRWSWSTLSWILPLTTTFSREEFWLHPIGAVPSSLHQKMKIPWKWGVAIVFIDSEILTAFCGLEEGASELQMSGFEFVNMIDYGLRIRSTPLICSLVVTTRWLQWWRKWDTCLAWGLGRKEGRGMVEYIDIKTQVTRKGLG